MEQWGIITKGKPAAIVILDMMLLGIRQGQDITGTLIVGTVLQLLSYVAQIEQEFIRQKRVERIATVKARGIKFDRKPMECLKEFEPLR